MKRLLWVVLGILALGGIGAGAWYMSLDKETRGVLASMPTNRDVLFWTEPQRDAAFRALDRLPVLAKANPIAKGPVPLALAAGQPFALEGLDTYMTQQRVAGLVIIQDGKVRVEKYGLGFDAAGRWTSFSVAKSLTSTLVGAAIRDGSIKSLEDKVSDYIPGLKGSAYDDVTVRQLLTMSSGVKWNEDYGDPNSDVAKFNNAKPEEGVDATVSYLKNLPRAHPPGEVWNYNTGETNLIGVLVSSATRRNLSEYLSEKVWKPAGMEQDATWLLGATGHEIAGCCIQASTRDFARFGLFVLAGAPGIVPDGWFAEAIVKQKDIGAPGRGYGFQWWTYDDGSVAAQGIFGQGIFIDAKRKLVIASNSNWVSATDNASQDRREAFYQAVQAAIDAETAKAPAGPLTLP
jgi:CubicO group peptidase (beta-lactamase class C family)